MDQFSQPVLSKKLLTILANSSTSTNQITFKRAIASSDKYKLDDLTAFDDSTIKVIKQVSETAFSNVAIKDNSIQLTAVFSSNGNASDYAINTVLFTAEFGGQEFLAFSQIANNSTTVPAGSTSEVFNLTLKPKIVIDSTKAISTSVNPDSVATNEYVEQKTAELGLKIDDIQSDQSELLTTVNEKISKTGNPQTVESKLTFTQPINGSITQSDTASSTSTLTLDSGTDLHAITDTGNSTYTLNGTYSNAPSDFTGKGVLNRSVSGQNIVLTVTDIATADKWTQTYNGSVWTDWQQGGWDGNIFYKEADIPSPTYASASYPYDAPRYTVTFSNMHIAQTDTTLRLTGNLVATGGYGNAATELFGYSINVGNLVKSTTKPKWLTNVVPTLTNIATNSGKEVQQKINTKEIDYISFNGSSFYIYFKETYRLGTANWTSDQINIDITVTY